ncbi:hypothetical protein [Rahnella laticis]|uniref:hypothetical protein n=1 Tax=Rahnella laticis TaxID=2787622 RepID=UPI0018A305F5|nr:hypothetical protein [Rahnella laticis]MBF7994418.1 hypothetical protein [Rahnella laticis]
MNTEKFAFPAFMFFIFVKAFSGPIGITLPFLNYSAVAFMLVLLVCRWLKYLLINPSVMILSGLFLFYTLVGVLNNGLIQALFGIYIFIPFLFSVSYSEVLFEKIIDNSKNIFLFFGISAIVGVMYVNINGAPWLGSVLEIGGHEKILSRDWTAGGALRNPGFTGASFDVATLMLICFFFTLYNLKKSKQWLFYLVVVLLPIYPIYLTTTKTTIVTYCILSVLILLPSIVNVIFSRIVMFFSVMFSYYYMLPGEGRVRYDETNTFLQRIYETWPKAMGLLTDNMSFLIGRGIGGIGTPSLLFSPRFYNPADNALVYLYVIGGVASVILVMFFLLKFVASSSEDRNISSFYYLLAFVIFTGGVTYNLFESVFYAPFTGLLIGTLFNRKFFFLRKFTFQRKPIEIIS